MKSYRKQQRESGLKITFNLKWEKLLGFIKVSKTTQNSLTTENINQKLWNIINCRKWNSIRVEILWKFSTKIAIKEILKKTIKQERHTKKTERAKSA